MAVSEPMGSGSIHLADTDRSRSSRDRIGASGKRDPLSERRKVVVPKWYSPTFHLFALLLMTILGVVGLWWGVELASVRAWAWLGIPAAIMFANFLEYASHRWPMHKRMRRFDRFFVRHTLSHHRWFTHTRMEIVSLKELYMVFFQVELVVGLMIMVIMFMVGARMTVGADIGAIFCSSLVVYLLALELVHAATHLPASWYRKWPFRGPVLRYLRAFHRTHHDPRLMRKGNFNVTFPLTDFALGTVLPVLHEDEEAVEAQSG